MDSQIPVSRRELLRYAASLTLPAAGFLNLGAASAADEALPAFQPFTAQIRRVMTAMREIGADFPEGDRAALSAALGAGDPERSGRLIQAILDRYVLVNVAINPESRVSVSRGSAPAALVENGWRSFLVKVVNRSGLTAELIAESPQAKADSDHAPGSEITGTGIMKPGAQVPVQSITFADVADRWLDLDMYNQPPLTRELSGLQVEYRILQLYSRDMGTREATISFNAGPTTRDLGFRSELPVLFRCARASRVTLGIRDSDGSPATASLVISDKVGRVYPSRPKRLAPDFPFQEQIYRADREFISLPSGEYTIQYSRGPEYLVKEAFLRVAESSGALDLELKLERWIDPAGRGWYSGDHHIHAAGCSHYNTPTEGVLPKDMVPQVRGEGLSLAEVLTWGPSWYYQKRFFDGRISSLSDRKTLLRYDVEVSGFPSSYWGHLVLLGLSEQDYPAAQTIEQWPTWNLPILKWAKAQGAAVGYAHTGHGLEVETDQLPNYVIPAFNNNGANEFLIDVAHGAVDFLSAADTPVNAELNIWYHALNCGFRVPIAGETDFPCLFERVGVGRSYVWLEKAPAGEAGYKNWINGMCAGQSYVSDGRSHLLDMQVDDVPLSQLRQDVERNSPGTIRVQVSAAALLAEKPADSDKRIWRTSANKSPYWHIERSRIPNTREVPVELVVNGRAVASQTLLGDGTVRRLEFKTHIAESSWVAVRILGSCHTNPVFIRVNGRPIRASRRSADWCIQAVTAAWDRLGQRISAQEHGSAFRAFKSALATFEAIRRECERTPG